MKSTGTAMRRDLRETDLYREIEARFARMLRPGSGTPSDLSDLSVSPDGARAAGICALVDALEGPVTTRLCLVDLEDGETRVASPGPNSDRLPRWSPDGRQIAYLSDRERAYMFALHLYDPATGEDRATPGLPGWAEYLHWSPDGRSILIGVAGFGADVAGAQGGTPFLGKDAEPLPEWMPDIDVGADETQWRSLWLFDLASESLRRVSPEGVNIWEAVWCGAGRAVAICSNEPGEHSWYAADVRLIDLANATARTLYVPDDQLGCLSSAPSGARVAVVEAVCSDRTIVAGDILIIDTLDGAVERTDAPAADVVQTQWQGDGHVLYCAHRSFETVVGVYDVDAHIAEPVWRDGRKTASGLRYGDVAALGATPGDVLFSREGFFDVPTLVALRGGQEREIGTYTSNETASVVAGLGSVDAFRWNAPDGLEIHGWLLTPPGNGPFPLIVDIHGGPVWQYRPRYLGKHIQAQTLLAHGYAVLMPNPRGSSCRGQDYARMVFGDMGGADTFDYLTGIDALVACGVVDPERIGVTGGSYGGFMSSWLITQDSRFAAAVPVAPVTNWVSEHLTCHIPHFCEMFLADRFNNPGGKYHLRSPVMFTDQVRTPTLNICGALDRNTPAGQALEFHHALLLNDVTSALVTYPLEGHGVRGMPTVIDYLTRLVGWFETHMPAENATRSAPDRQHERTQ